FFFFSSRRRHTRWPRDWSSDVCSSDLGRVLIARCNLRNARGHPIGWPLPLPWYFLIRLAWAGVLACPWSSPLPYGCLPAFPAPRSEERRVGKECGCVWWEDE